MAKNNNTRKNNINHFWASSKSKVSKDKIDETHQVFRSFKAKSRANRTKLQVLSDAITRVSGSVLFAIVHVVWFTVWILINTGNISGFPIFDPYPFGFLTLVVSLEAIFLSIFVLVSQNREAQITDLREEVDFQLGVVTEQEVSKLINLVDDIHKNMGLHKRADKETVQMKEKLDVDKIQHDIEKEV